MSASVADSSIGFPRCFCGKLANVSPMRGWVPGPTRANLSDHGYARCSEHLRKNACPGCRGKKY